MQFLWIVLISHKCSRTQSSNYCMQTLSESTDMGVSQSSFSGCIQVLILWVYPSPHSLGVSKSSFSGCIQVLILWVYPSPHSLGVSKSSLSGCIQVLILWVYPSPHSLGVSKSSFSATVWGLMVAFVHQRWNAGWTLYPL